MKDASLSLVLLASLAGLPASGEQLVVSCETYTTLLEPDPLPDANYATVNELHVDGAPFPTSALMRFDLSPLAPGTPVVGVRLAVTLSNVGADYTAYPLLRGFDESTATWLVAAAGSPWAEPGAGGVDRGSAALFSLGSSGSAQWTAAGVGVVQQWIDLPGTNRGFVVVGRLATSTDSVAFSSAEAASVSSRPALVLTLDGGGTVVLQAGDGGYVGAVDTTIIGVPAANTPLAGRNVLVADEPVPMGIHAVALIRCGVPPGVRPVSASISLPMANASVPAVRLRECLVPWDVTTATWSLATANRPWGAPGASGAADRGPVLATGQRAGAALTFTLGAAGLAMVERWGQGANAGFLLFSDGSVGQHIAAGAPSLVLELDGGVDGGSASPDGGSPDGGAPGADGGSTEDGGETGEPPLSPSAWRVGCGCDQTSFPAAVVIGVLLWRRLRSRAPERGR